VSEAHDVVDIIRTKRDGGELADDQIDWVVDAYTRGVVADEQMSALAMAIVLNGMQRSEVSRWTAAMIASGQRMSFDSLSRPTADKHSTGGVGDKITLPLAPLVAACGVAVPQLSGRGLGHTGGTLDKLEAIAGWNASLSNDAMMAQLEDVGAVICAAGAELAPADKKLYALRDVTGTVESIPLIASSIMSKKIAEGTGALVLDVKVGSGAFMKDAASARELAETMVERLDALAVGIAAWRLGAGRARKEDAVQAGAGVEMHAKPGDTVRTGQPLLTLHTDDEPRFDRALAALDGAFSITDDASAAPAAGDVVLDRVAGD
jgi:thymidine phosphorylase